jgi:hypothetical protein
MQPVPGLGGIIPFDLLYTPGGIGLVAEVLLRGQPTTASKTVACSLSRIHATSPPWDH